MKCPRCKEDISIKKNKHIDCKCGAKLMCIEAKKELILVEV